MMFTRSRLFTQKTTQRSVMRRLYSQRASGQANSSRFSRMSRMLPLAATASALALATYLSNSGESVLFSRAQAEPEMVSVEVGSPEDFLENQLREVQVGAKEEETILIVRLDGKLYACGSKCSHFGAPLSKGMLFEDRIYCPWHLASFSVRDGFPENGPMMDGIPTYKISIVDGKVVVNVPKTLTMRKPVPTVTRDPNNQERFVIIGGGVAASSAADTLRQTGFTGEIVMLSKEDFLPYDRTIITKNIGGVKIDNILFRSQEYMDRLGIEVRTGTTVTDVNPSSKRVTLADGSSLSYSKLLIASGVSPRTPSIPGVNLGNIFTVHGYADAEKLREAASSAKHVVVIGGGFIGTEAASTIKMMRKEGVTVQIVTRGPEPYTTSLGPQVGRAMRLLSEEKGINFVVNSKVVSINGDSSVQSVTLQDGTVIEADLVILGVGSQPNTQFLGKGIALEEDGSVSADFFLRSNTDNNVFVAGDVASYPYFYTQERVRTEHISEAISMGAFAAYNMMDKMRAYNGVPFFWTRAFNKSLASVGVIKGYDSIVVDGDVPSQAFAAYYLKQGQVIGASGMGRGKDLILLNQAMRLNITVGPDMFLGSKLDLDRLHKIILDKRPRCGCQKGKIICTGQDL